MLTLLTATGCRPEAWALCERWMARQTYAGPVRWIIVDDGRDAQPVTFQRLGWTLEIVRPSPFWRLGDNTQARNLLAGLRRVEDTARLVVIEDDDWYAPDWLQTIADALEGQEMAGESRARYYNVEARVGREMPNERHASLCATAVTGRGIAELRAQCVRAVKFIDLDLWRRPLKKRLIGGHRVVGIKGLPGRGGIGCGHRSDFKGIADPDGRLLRDWVGTDDAAVYDRALERMKGVTA